MWPIPLTRKTVAIYLNRGNRRSVCRAAPAWARVQARTRRVVEQSTVGSLTKGLLTAATLDPVIVDPEQHELAAVVERLPPVEECRVVEIGCGDGRLTRRYCNRVASVLAVDSDTDLLSAFCAAGIAAHVSVQAISIEHLEVPEDSVDAALFSWAL